MSEGVCIATHTEVGISITGIAGPDGATDTKPVGLYHIGLAMPHEKRSWRHIFDGFRTENNQMAAMTALEHLLSILS
jgi:nicotinamide-nucleotide amidase